MATYLYKVLREVKADDPVGVIYDPVGEFKAKDPGSAALAAAELERKPGTYLAVTARHFNEVPIIPTTGYAIADQVEHEPEPAGDVAASDDLDPSLEPEQPCETEECGHLPGQHGAKGLGICRIEGCPCGKYEPAP